MNTPMPDFQLEAIEEFWLPAWDAREVPRQDARRDILALIGEIRRLKEELKRGIKDGD